MPVTRGAQVTGVAVCALCLSWISVSLRFYVRTRILKFFGKEDWLTVAAMVLLTILCALPLELTNYGLGQHISTIPDDELPIGAKYVFVCELLYVATTAMVKFSIGMFYLRLAGRRYQRLIIWGTMGVIALISTMYFFFILFQCKPVDFLWTYYYGAEGSCLSHQILANITYAHAAMSAVTDYVFALLPVSFVWKMKMNMQTKISIVFILSLGFFASSATLVRIVYIRDLTITDDYSWEGINLVKWSMVEPAIGITAAAIATLRPLFTKFFPDKRPTTSNTEHKTSNESRYYLSRGSQDAFSEEFAAMLGLTRVGVTTTISAGGEDDTMRLRRTKKRRESEGSGMGASEGSEGGDWAGIMRTTVITTDYK